MRVSRLVNTAGQGFVLQQTPSSVSTVNYVGLSPDERWTTDAVRCFVVRKGHYHDASLRQWYGRRVQQVFAADPEFAEKLARFAG